MQCPICTQALEGGELVMVCIACHQTLGGGLSVGSTGEFRVPSLEELEAHTSGERPVAKDACAWCHKSEGQVKKLLARAKDEVRARGLPCAEEIPLGVMIEVPSAAVMASAFAEEAAFMSLGTNDLIQYALAVDRTSRSLAYLASPFDPAIVRLIQGVVRAGREHACPVSVCGAMASDPLAALLLVGLGVRDLSMEAAAIPEIKEALARIPASEAEAVVAEALGYVTAEEVEHCVAAAFAPRLYDLLTGERG